MNKMLKGLVYAAALVGIAAATDALGQTASLLPNGQQQFVDGNGQPFGSGTVGFFVPGTSTPKTVWSDPAQANVLANPVQLDGQGRATIYGSGQYQEVLKDSSGNQIWSALTADYTGFVIGNYGCLTCNNTWTGTNTFAGAVNITGGFEINGAPPPYVTLVQLQQQPGNFGIDIATAPNQYQVTLSPQPANFAALVGVPIRFLAASENTGNSFMTITGLGFSQITTPSDQALPAGAIFGGGIYEVIYNGTNFDLVSNPSNSITQQWTAGNVGAVVGGTVNAGVLTITGNGTFGSSNVVTGSRSVGPTFTNGTGKPMFVSVTVDDVVTDGSSTLEINGVPVAVVGQQSGGDPTVDFQLTGMVPAGATYRVIGGASQVWVETD